MNWIDKLQRKQARDDLMKAVADDYQSGIGLDNLRIKYDLPSRNYIYRCLEKHGVPIRPNKGNGQAFGQRIAADLSDREQIKQIAKMLGAGYCRMEEV